MQCVRKHQAPKGALRQADLTVQLDLVGSVRKHRAPKGALRFVRLVGVVAPDAVRSESTKRHKVH